MRDGDAADLARLAQVYKELLGDDLLDPALASPAAQRAVVLNDIRNELIAAESEFERTADGASQAGSSTAGVLRELAKAARDGKRTSRRCSPRRDDPYSRCSFLIDPSSRGTQHWKGASPEAGISCSLCPKLLSLVPNSCLGDARLRNSVSRPVQGPDSKRELSRKAFPSGSLGTRGEEGEGGATRSPTSGSAPTPE